MLSVPDVGDAQEVVVVEILVTPGDAVAEGDSLVVLESDKASMEIPADAAGVVQQVLVQEGDEVKEGDPLVTLIGEVPLSEVVAQSVNFELTEAERAALDEAGSEERAVFDAINAVLDARSNTGWTSGGHTGVDVPLYATGPGSDRFHGVMQNEELGRAMCEVFLPD